MKPHSVRSSGWPSTTRLPNRTLYLIRLQEAVDRAGIDASPLVVLHIKLAKLTEICEVLGFGASEYLVSQMAQRLKRHTTPGHTLSRIADGNFALFLTEGLETAREFARLLASEFEDATEFEGITVDMSLQIGIAQHHACITSASEINRRAESALRHGIGVIKSYIGAKDRENASALVLVSDLQHTIRKNGLALYFQPKVDLRTRTVVGAEALVRWRHPAHGDIAPSRFIPLAERSNMISQITSWMLGAVHAQLLAWQKSGLRWPVAINLSAHDLNNQALMDTIAEFAAGIDPSLVQFELTESVLIEDPLAARRSLERLNQLGFALAIDDFGTGFAGLSYLQNFPFDYIKIDQSFVIPMLDNASADAIVRSTIDLGHQLGRRVIAEGVEDHAVWTRLQAYGCDIAQGYLISKPFAAADFGDWVARWTTRTALEEAECDLVP
jgi:EAL domain-containing protein (putative c-di-GMP-specific phosphodiesterase class I)/GGDEF domain-containing protein